MDGPGEMDMSHPEEEKWRNAGVPAIVNLNRN